jgi:hypothetical protein
VAIEVTRLLWGRVRESRQLIKHLGEGRERIEYLEPPKLRGEVIITTGGRSMHFVPRPSPRVFERADAGVQWSDRLDALRRAVRTGRLQATVAGTELVAGREAAIVELRPVSGGPMKRLWLDVTTGVRLRNEVVAADGAVLSTSYFTQIDYQARIDAEEVAADLWPGVARMPAFPSGRPAATVADARVAASFALAEPGVPAGYRLTGVWVMDDGARAVMRYTDGINTYAVYQESAAKAAAAPRPAPWGPMVRGGVVHWRDPERHYWLVGNVSPAQWREVARRLR